MSYQVEDTALWRDVEDVIAHGDAKTNFTYRAMIHTEAEDFPAWRVVLYEGVRDYAAKLSDHVNLAIKMGVGDYVNHLYPYRRNLEVTITRSLVQSDEARRGGETDASLVIRYKAIFNPSTNPPVGGSDLEQHNSNDLNQNMVDIYLELVDRSAEVLRIVTTRAGSFQRQTVQEAIASCVMAECATVLIDGKPSIDRLDMVDADNTDIGDTLSIPHDQPILSVPTYVQEKLTGVYGAGIGTYIQRYRDNKTLFIYPLYDVERADKTTKKAIFYAVPQRRLPGVEKTFWKDGDTLKIIVTGNRLYNDDAGLSDLNTGAGYRVADAGAMMRKPVVIQNGQVYGARANLNHEVVNKAREDGLNYAPRLPPSANTYVLRSTITATGLAQIDLSWENCDPELIYPGMPCEYNYLVQGKPVKLRGTILFVHFTATWSDDRIYRVGARISIGAENQTKKPTIGSGGPASDQYDS